MPERSAPLVLVVDDEEDILLLCRVNLEFEGFRVEVASSGEEGLRKARRLRPDLVLLDVMMPAVDGWQVLESLKEDAATASIPVVMLTARVQADDQVRGWAGGAVDYVTKPFSPIALIAAIRTVLDLAGPDEAERRRVRSLDKLRLADPRT
jgi:DNA-binding response OmpR family regulator